MAQFVKDLLFVPGLSQVARRLVGILGDAFIKN